MPVFSTKSSGVISLQTQNRAFDLWLERKLHDIFDSVVTEPIPPDLKGLLDQLDKLPTPDNESELSKD